MKMGKERKLKMARLSLILYLVLFAFTLSCATTTSSNDQASSNTTHAPFITKVETIPSAQTTTIKITCDKPALYTAFQLADPPRIILDINGKQGPELASVINVKNGNINQIRFQEGTVQAASTRMTIELDTPLTYQAEAVDNIIQLTFKTKAVTTAPVPEETQPVLAEQPIASGPETTAAAKPRIFFQPKASDLNQVLGIDFAMLDQGKSRLVVTTDKKSTYDLKQQNAKTLILKLGKTTVPDLLKRQLDARHFEGVVDQVKASFVQNEKQVIIAILLREMVPFHVNQTDNEINIDFAQTMVRPPDRKIVPLQMAEMRNQPITPIMPIISNDATQTIESSEPTSQPFSPGANSKQGTQISDNSATETSSEQTPQSLPGLKKRYRGEPMTMDFVNADITNILVLISQVSNLNIVWGPEVQGTVSMKLKNVPWDQALDMILTNNNLAKREQGNVIWITTSAKMAQFETDEKKKREDAEAEIKSKFDAKKKQEEVEPMVTMYYPLNFASCKDLKPHLEAMKTARGKVSEDERTNTIVLTDVADIQRKAKEIIKYFDLPVKQIMIEARIVDASDDFARSLGIKWTDKTDAWKLNKWYDGQTLTIPPGAEKTTGKSPDVKDPIWDGQMIGGGSFSTNSPGGWAANLGMTLAAITQSGKSWVTLDAKLALSEAEGKTKTISAPKVMAREGTEAVIKRGDSIFQVESTPTGTAWKEIVAMLSLKVTPVKVSYNDFIILKVVVTDDRPANFGERIGVNTKAIETNLMVKTGDTVVIGGIYKEASTDG
ncbi:MAG: type IV pilus secretin family protein [Desulfobacteraceae bacterium]|nr:MAG: type IV pilus secretin family protein [Desulfobacteraceae bacterium]